MINPVQEINQLLIFLLAVLLLGAAYKYRHRVIFLFTGDDRIHMGFLDFIYFWCCRCGGICDGEWTRRFSQDGINLKQEAGRKLGVVSIPVLVTNIVAGDLPFKGAGDFYLTVEVGDNPPMSTAVTENTTGKVVHFNQPLVCRVRDSVLENQIRFVVKELNIFGSQEVAELRLSPVRFCEWVRVRPNKVMRFQLEPMDTSFDSDKPAWLAFELEQSQQWRGSEKFKVHLKDQETGMFHTVTSKEFKYHYHLVDRTGEPAAQNEPEDNAEVVHRVIQRKKAEGCCIATFVLIIVFGAIGWRLYLWKCWKEFREITQKNKGNMVAMPTHDEIMQTCDSVTGAERPVVFNRWAHEYWGGHSIPCFAGVCQVRDQFVEYRVPFFIVLTFLVLIAMYHVCKTPDIAIRKTQSMDSDSDDDHARGVQISERSRRTVEASHNRTRY